LNQLKLTLHPDKTYIGKTEQGFDFLGYFIQPGGLSLSLKTTNKALTKLRRLYEQGKPITACRLYWQRFTRWATAGLHHLIDDTLHQQIDAIGLRLMDQLKEYHHEDFTEICACW
jgi:hypothetical protein